MNPSTGKVATALSLTPRELEVLQLLWAGYVSHTIAKQLGISIKTVGAHRANIRNKTGTRNTAQLLKVALESGILAI